MKTRAVFFDLGNTLVSYYRARDFEPVLQRCVDAAAGYLREQGLNVDTSRAMEKALRRNRERHDHDVTPIAGRLSAIFDLEINASLKHMDNLIERFMGPVFDTATLNLECIGVLQALSDSAITTGLISNTPWGSPSALWRAHLDEIGLSPFFDDVVFCVDVGKRKPHKAIFLHALERQNLKAEETIFVGDDPVWDAEGALRAGLKPVLFDPAGNSEDGTVAVIRQLRDILNLV